MSGEIPSTSISFSSIRSAYNNINSPLELPQNFSMSDLRGIKFIQPLSEVTLTTDYETVYTNPSTYNFVVPDGVTEVSAVCVGGGGGAAGTGGDRGGGGGGGGGLAYGTFTVTPGETLTVRVGVGGLSGTSNTSMGSPGGESYIRRNATTLLSGGGGGGGRNGSSAATGGTSSGSQRDGGGTGGAGGAYAYNNAGGAGGGAAGYSGNGGGGANGNGNSGGGNGSGGGGGGGSTNSSSCGGGGGVGLYGEGASGVKPSSSGDPGTGGSGGTNGSVGNNSSHGGVCGGGGGADDDDFNSSTSGNGDGGKGGVRIIWSPISNSRYYPSTKTTTNSVVEGYGGDPVDPISSSGPISINDHLKGNTIDVMKPQMTITSSSVDNGGSYSDSSLSLTFTSTESTSDFTIDDIIVTKGTLSNFNSVSDKVYTVDLATTEVEDDEHQVSVNQGAYTNNETTIGCQNLSVTPFIFTYGTVGILQDIMSLATTLNSITAVTNTGSAKQTDVLTAINNANSNFNVFAIVGRGGKAETLTGRSFIGRVTTAYGMNFFINNGGPLGTGGTIARMTGAANENSSLSVADGKYWMAGAFYTGSEFKGIIIWVFTGKIINGSGIIQSETRDNSQVKKIFYPDHTSGIYSEIYPIVIGSNGTITNYSVSTSTRTGWSYSNNQQSGVNGYHLSNKFSLDDGAWGFVMNDQNDGNAPGLYLSNGENGKPSFGINNQNAGDTTDSYLYWNFRGSTIDRITSTSAVGFIFSGDYNT